MQQMGKILENNLTQICSAPQNSSTNQKSEKAMSSHSASPVKHRYAIDLLFSRFAAFYGHVWRSQFKDKKFMSFAKKEWEEALAGFNDSIINSVTEECRGFCEMPPTLPMFLRYCREARKRSNFRVVADYTPAPKAVVQQSINQCKAYLFQKP